VPHTKPYHALSVVKKRVRDGDVLLRQNALSRAYSDFNWGGEEIKQCLLKLNDRVHTIDPERNHYYKTERHRHFPTENTMMDYYKAKRIMFNESIYTHIYIRDGQSTLIVSSFKDLFRP
jgi:hypothetical protein